MITISRDVHSLGVRIPIRNLALELAEFRPGGIYCVGATSRIDLMTMCRQMLVDADSTTRVALVSDCDYSDLLVNTPHTVGPADLRYFQLKGDEQRALSRVSKDLDRALAPRSRLIVLVISEASIPSTSVGWRLLLNRWNAWLSANGCALLILFDGEHVEEQLSELLPLNDVVEGLALLKHEASGALYRVIHWRNALGVNGPSEMSIAVTESGFSVVVQAEPTFLLSTDKNKFFLDRVVLEGASIFMAKDWHVCESWSELYDHALTSTSATIVFSLVESSELPVLARTLHSIRKQRGNALKLVVRAMQRHLRYSDEQTLLDCGATLVIPSETQLSGFIALLEAVQHQTYRRQLSTDPEAVLDWQQSVIVSGKVSVDTFTNYVNAVNVKAARRAENGALVALVPVPGLSAQQTLLQLRMRREGDVACELEGVVYVFLLGCRPGFIDIALENVFRLPYREMFSEQRVHLTNEDILKENNALKYRATTTLRDELSSYLTPKTAGRETSSSHDVPSGEEEDGNTHMDCRNSTSFDLRLEALKVA